MRIKLWGTRGSIPSPLRAIEIEKKLQVALSSAAEAAVDLADPGAVRAFITSLPYAIRGTAGGDTSCLEVRSGGNLFIFDCGSGLRQLGMELMEQEFGRGQGVAHIFMSHTHWDHMIGWPFFAPGYVPGNRFYIYGVHADLEQRFRIQQTAPLMFPISLDHQAAEVEFIILQQGDTIEFGQTRIRNIGFMHAGESYGYRIEDEDGALVYATDNEYKSLEPAATEHYVEFFRDADVLVFDAMFSLPESYQKEDWGHSSAIAGADLATRAGVKRLLLFHHDPYANDEQIWSLRDQAEEYLKQHPERPPCEVVVAYDGWEIQLWREAELETRTEDLEEGIVIHLRGRLVGDTAPLVLDAVDEARSQAGNRPLVVNLDQMVHLDREGLAALFLARRNWRPLSLCGLRSELRHNFGKDGALEHIAVFDTPSDALAGVTQGLQLRRGQMLRNRYEIGEPLDPGPLGDLYRATDQLAHRQVRLLVLCPSLGRSTVKAIMESARAATELRHPLIAEVYDVNRDGEIRYVVMEHTSGRSIRELLVPSASSSADSSDLSGPSRANEDTNILSPIQAVGIGSQIAQALEYIHSQTTVHGCLNPGNVILLDDGSIKLTGIGIGRPKAKRPMSELPAYMGPFDYLAPEQLQGHSNSPSSDLYALGTILYEMLTGHTPFAATSNDLDLISLKLRQRPVPPRRRNPKLSRSLEHLVLTLLSKSPGDRPSSAAVVRQTLTNLNHLRQAGSLLNRESLVQKLQHHLERVAQGQSGLLVIRGPRAIGKSRLVMSMADQRVANRALATLRAELYAHEDTRPYRLFVEALRPVLLSLAAHRLSQLLNDLGDLARPLTALMPGLQPTISSFESTDLDCEGLEEAVGDTLRLLTDDGPMLLVLDSLQWIDAASLRLFNRLARERIPYLLIVALYRTEAIDHDHPLRHSLDGLESWIDEQLDVPALGPIDVHQMASVLSAQAPPDFGLWLYGETGGNPLHIEQLIRAYLEGPSEARHPRERTTARTLEGVILRRLEGLSSGAVTTLRQAAVLGNTFPFDRLCAALERPAQEVLTYLNSALQFGLISGNAVEDWYCFEHPLIREVIYADMLSGMRQSHHWRAAQVLEQEGFSGPLDEKLDLLAHHFLQAGESEKALTYLARATRRARLLCAPDAALHYVDQALVLVEQLDRLAADEREHEHRRKQRSDLLAVRSKLEETLAQ